MYYIGLDIHKKSISFCVKGASGQIYQQGKVAAIRRDLDAWMRALPKPWTAAMEATIFTGWIYDHLKPHAAAVKVAHPLMLRAIAASKKKNDRIDASRIADCLRDFMPECHMDSLEIRERRRALRYRSLPVRQIVQLKTRLASLLMETGVSYDMSRSCWPVRMSLRADGKYETTFDYQLPMSGPQKVTFEILPPSGSCHLLLSRRLDEPFSNIAHCDQLNDYMDVVIP